MGLRERGCGPAVGRHIVPHDDRGLALITGGHIVLLESNYAPQHTCSLGIVFTDCTRYSKPFSGPSQGPLFAFTSPLRLHLRSRSSQIRIRVGFALALAFTYCSHSRSHSYSLWQLFSLISRPFHLLSQRVRCGAFTRSSPLTQQAHDLTTPSTTCAH